MLRFDWVHILVTVENSPASFTVTFSETGRLCVLAGTSLVLDADQCNMSFPPEAGLDVCAPVFHLATRSKELCNGLSSQLDLALRSELHGSDVKSESLSFVCLIAPS